MGLTGLDWDQLLDSIKKKKCTPFIGAGAPATWIRASKELANEWAIKYGYPLDDKSQLSRVAQFVAIEEGSDSTPKGILSREIERISPPNFSLEQYRNTAYAVLADLNLPIYITTNYDHFLEGALKSKGKSPVSEFCAWNKGLEEYMEDIEEPTVFKRTLIPSVSNPLVYHLHGDFNEPNSMVLTEDDYIEFMTYLVSRGETIIPQTIKKALVTGDLIFIGYSLEDVNLRVILKSISSLGGRRGVAVLRQRPGDPSNSEKYQNYIDKYTKYMFKMHVYWGDLDNFSKELRDRWNESQK